MSTQEALIDRWGRRINYLRVSITEDCNFRCVYCVPGQAMAPAKGPHLLTVPQIESVVRAAASLGVRRVRLTGGEPTLRSDLPDIVRALKAVPGIEEVSLTTNGSQLAALAAALKDAGLDRINVSLDSLGAERFRAVTGVDRLPGVRAGVFAAFGAGLPVKLNVVAIKGLTHDEIRRFIALAVHHPIDVRFLEYMPLCGSAWRSSLFVPIRDVRRIAKTCANLEELPRNGDVAQTFRIRNGKGRVGFIASLTESFCNDCSRMRLSADGRLYPCLFSDRNVPMGALLADDADLGRLAEALREAARLKPRGNSYRDAPFQESGPATSVAATTPLIRKLGG